MSLPRRTLLLGAGGGLALVAAGGFWRVTRAPQTAAAPWAIAADDSPDVRLSALRHAILAPNPHNRQPWLIRLEGTTDAQLFCDLDRRLPATDPFDRQILIGFGAFLELLRLAAASRGVRLDVTEFPEGAPGARLDGRPIAHLRFQPDPAIVPDRLFDHVLARRSNKEAYDLERQIDPAKLARLEVSGPDLRVATTSDRVSVANIRDLVLRALDIEMDTPRTHRESIDLIRIGARAVDAQPDGIDLSGPMIEAGAALGQITHGKLADPASTAFAQGKRQLHATYGAAPAYLWLVTRGNDRTDQLATGATYVRANLAATELGLSLHPASQALQEYPEMVDCHRAIQALLAPDGGRVQMLARLGYGPDVPPAPRYPLEAKLIV